MPDNSALAFFQFIISFGNTSVRSTPTNLGNIHILQPIIIVNTPIERPLSFLLRYVMCRRELITTIGGASDIVYQITHCPSEAALQRLLLDWAKSGQQGQMPRPDPRRGLGCLDRSDAWRWDCSDTGGDGGSSRMGTGYDRQAVWAW